ncbi:type II toxin-antitoxin system death-on-curing family toxin [Brevibacillus laterosporus]|nr:type II toxin-antitoxin system death-on-curing family toxin [Brevibacillus laterosporus]TPG74356.1 type II toxin-antitoxin system death-on-curing family toxin [Brevibacillus laterosporus]
MKFLTVREAISINSFLIKKYSPEEQLGVKDMSSLESAVYRPQTTAFQKPAYQNIFEMAAALLESLAKNHPFHNANKRTAFTAMVTFLFYNELIFVMDQKKAEDFVVDVVNHKYSFEEIAVVIEDHCQKKSKTAIEPSQP